MKNSLANAITISVLKYNIQKGYYYHEQKSIICNPLCKESDMNHFMTQAKTLSSKPDFFYQSSINQPTAILGETKT